MREENGPYVMDDRSQASIGVTGEGARQLGGWGGCLKGRVRGLGQAYGLRGSKTDMRDGRMREPPQVNSVKPKELIC